MQDWEKNNFFGGGESFAEVAGSWTLPQDCRAPAQALTFLLGHILQIWGTFITISLRTLVSSGDPSWPKEKQVPQPCASTPVSHSFVRFVQSRIKPLPFKLSLSEWSCFLCLHFVQPEMFFPASRKMFELGWFWLGRAPRCLTGAPYRHTLGACIRVERLAFVFRAKQCWTVAPCPGKGVSQLASKFILRIVDTQPNIFWQVWAKNDIGAHLVLNLMMRNLFQKK